MACGQSKLAKKTCLIGENWSSGMVKSKFALTYFWLTLLQAAFDDLSLSLSLSLSLEGTCPVGLEIAVRSPEPTGRLTTRSSKIRIFCPCLRLS